MRRLLMLLAILAPLFAPLLAWGQSPPAPHPGDRPWGAWLGASFTSPVDTYWGGTTPGRSLFLVGVRAHYVVETVGSVALAFTADLIPAALVSNNPRWRWRVLTADGEEYKYKEITDSGLVYGAGFSPIGLHVSAPVWRDVRAYAAGAVGGLWFTREVPLPEARRFNYSLEFGGGLDVAAGATHVVVIGLKVHHLSNMNTARANPGLDGHVFYLGLLRRRKALR
jgi:hypothetical protein